MQKADTLFTRCSALALVMKLRATVAQESGFVPASVKPFRLPSTVLLSSAEDTARTAIRRLPLPTRPTESVNTEGSRSSGASAQGELHNASSVSVVSTSAQTFASNTDRLDVIAFLRAASTLAAEKDPGVLITTVLRVLLQFCRAGQRHA